MVGVIAGLGMFAFRALGGVERVVRTVDLNSSFWDERCYCRLIRALEILFLFWFCLRTHCQITQFCVFANVCANDFEKY